MSRKSGLKDVEVRLIAELMKNSRRSDRKLAQIIGVAQPTVSRIIKKLEHMGIIKEYTIIPDFHKLGYEIMGITSINVVGSDSTEDSEKSRKAAIELEKRNPHASLMAVSGVGEKKNRVFISFYKDYSAYAEAMNLTKQLPFVDVDTLDSFLVGLSDETNYRMLSMSAIAQHLLKESKGRTHRTN